MSLPKEQVKRWQFFLVGFFVSTNKNISLVADGIWGPKTENATKLFQERCGIPSTGLLDKKTLEAANDYGFSNNVSLDSQFPISRIERLSHDDLISNYGSFSFEHSPVEGNPEAIKVTDDWATKNLVKVSLPGLSHLLKKPVMFHKNGADKLFNFFSEILKRGFSQKVLSWDGSYAPRYVRGSRTRLSNHAWATAFDINAMWNPIGATPALRGTKGSVYELVEIANDCGFYWGGHFTNRPDGMHFELGKKK
jgi:hypothetical protein